MRSINLSGREATVVRAIGFTETALGADLQDATRMELDDITVTINGLISAGFVESIPYTDSVDLAELPVTSFEVNPAYARELKDALRRR
jgi:hypothetical protein